VNVDISDSQELARAFENLREQQRASSSVLRSVARGASLQEVLDEVVQAATRLSAGTNGRLWLLRDGLLNVVAYFGSREGFDFDTQPRVLDRTTLAGRAAVTRDVVHLPDVNADPEYTYAGPRHFRSGLSVAILLEGELIGVIAIVRDEVGPFADEHVELLRSFADQAAIAIANARLIEAVERQRKELSRFLSPQVAELISSPEGEQLLAGHRAYITCLFCDLRGFTAFAETAAPEELFDVLRTYHQTLGELIETNRGTLEHFAGDGVMVFFNDPITLENHELQAIKLGLIAQERIGELAQTWHKRGIQLGLGIGIEAGYATLGRIGFEGRYDYGALGPVTNLASRLSSQARMGQTLIGSHVYGAVEDAIEAAPVGELELKGFGRPVRAYEVRALRD
jgi:class 3 adenylate cyclase/putative methionine-R-sulfoxide reductase with GAF domain